MSATKIKDVSGFTPLIDSIVQKRGIMVAAVFGKVWRYCQMSNGSCSASITRLAVELELSRITVMRHLETLVIDGYLSKGPATGRTIVYKDTGKAGIKVTVEAFDESDNSKNLIPEMYQIDTPEVSNIDIKKQVMKQEKIESISPKEPAIPPPPIPEGKPPKAIPDPRSKHPAIMAFREITARFPGREVFDKVIEEVGENPDLELMKSCRVEWLARGYNANSIKWLDWYKAGGVPRNGRNFEERSIEVR